MKLHIWLALCVIAIPSAKSQSLGDASLSKSIAKLCTNIDEKTPIERIKACTDLEKNRIDQERLDFDKSRRNGPDFLISLIQVGAAVVAVGVPVWLAWWSTRNDRNVRTENEKLQFQLKVAEIAMNARDSGEAKAKADMLTALFSDRLPPGFTSKIDTAKLSFGPGREMRMELLKLLATYPDQREVVLKTWSYMWPGDISKEFKPPPDGRYLWLPELMNDEVISKNESKHSDTSSLATGTLVP